MPAGRPRGLQLDPATPSPVRQGVVDIRSRGRAQLPSHLMSSLTWVPKPKQSIEALAVLEPGYLFIVPWKTEGLKVLARRADLIALSEKDSEALFLLTELENRYKRIEISSDYRVTLSSEITLHLELSDSEDSRAFAFLVKDRIELHSKSYHEQMLEAKGSVFDDLP